MLITKREEVTRQGFCKILWRKLRPRGSLLLKFIHSSGWVGGDRSFEFDWDQEGVGWRILIMICHVRSDKITWNEVHRGILFDRRLSKTENSLRGRRLKGKGKGALWKGVLGAREIARGARGRREGNACQETIVFYQANVKILIGQNLIRSK